MGPERDLAGRAELTATERRRQGEGEAARRGDHHDARQGLPAEPGARRRQQLGVAEPEPFAPAHPAIDAADHGEDGKPASAPSAWSPSRRGIDQPGDRKARPGSAAR